MFLHKAIDLTDWEAARFAVFQSHGNQTAKKKINKKPLKLFKLFKAENMKYTKESLGDLVDIIFHYWLNK